MPIADLFAQIKSESIRKANAKSAVTLPQWFFNSIGVQRRPIAPFTHETKLSASRLHDLCPRYETLRAQRQLIDYDEFHPELRFIFDIGTLYHSLYRDWHMGKRGLYLGKWKCLVCGWTTDGAADDTGLDSDGLSLTSYLPPGQFPNKHPMRFAPMPEKCGGCGSPRRGKAYTVSGREVEGEHPLIVFDEWPMVNEQYGIHAMSDGWRLVLANRTIRNQEIKSISRRGFEEAKKRGAQPKHKTQSMICTWMSGVDIGEVIYINKAGWESPEDFIHVVPIKVDMGYMEKHVFGPITTMREHLKAGTQAPRTCESEHCKTARECQLAALCFQEKG